MGIFGFNTMLFYIYSKFLCLVFHFHDVSLFTDESLIVYGFCVV